MSSFVHSQLLARLLIATNDPSSVTLQANNHPSRVTVHLPAIYLTALTLPTNRSSAAGHSNSNSESAERASLARHAAKLAKPGYCVFAWYETAAVLKQFVHVQVTGG